MTIATTTKSGRPRGTAAVAHPRHQGRADNAKGSRSRTVFSRSAIAVICIALLAFLSACSDDAAKNRLEVTDGDIVTYQAENGDRVTAKYYSLSDKSLDFVKVTLPDGKEYTLPCVLSASGARYTDDRELVWWTKGDTAQAEKRDKSGEWKTLYSECREIGDKRKQE